MGAARKLGIDRRSVYGDFFCGGGGLSKGFAKTIEKLGIKNVRLLAINHSQVAVETHKANFPWAEHHCARMDQVDPRKLVPNGRMKLAMFAPECTNHANARGGRPINDQSRATAWDVIKWAQELYIETILVENVREIMDWGPLGADGRPLQSKKGQIFRQWIEAIKACGYHVDYRILNAADYGAATTRKRFFLIARRANQKITWPEPTHAKDANPDLFGTLKPWRGAWEIINWDKKGIDIQEREKYGLKPLRPNTLARIAAGIRKFWGPFAEPFIVQLRGTSKSRIKDSPRSIGDPVPVVTGGGIHAGLVQPFVVAIDHGSSNGNPRGVRDPLPTVMTKDRLALVQPFVLQQQSGGAPRSTEDPLPSIAGKGAVALVQPFIIGTGGPEGSARNPRSVDDPLGTVMPGDHKALIQPFIITPGGADLGVGRTVDQPMPTVLCHERFALVRPFIVPFFGERDGQAPRTHCIKKPLPAVTSHGAGGFVEPFIVQVNHGTKSKGDTKGRVRSCHQPIGTITGENGNGLVQPLLVKYYKTGRAQPVTRPVPTLTGKDRFALVTPSFVELPEGYELRAYFRMFDDLELARAMGFDGHEFKGTKKQRILMIGNAVEVHQAEALITAILS